MNSTDKPTHNDVFLNARKAYRLLHDYQRMVLDGVRYIEAQLDIPFAAGWTRFSDDDVRSGYTKLNQSPWDWLPMMWYEFHFVKAIEKEWLNLSLFIISDTGWIEGDDKANDIDDWSAYIRAEKSSSKFIFILRKTNTWREVLPFMDNKSQMREFIKEGGCLPEDLKQKGFVGKCYNLSCLTSESAANEVVSDIVKSANEKSWLLEHKKK